MLWVACCKRLFLACALAAPFLLAVPLELHLLAAYRTPLLPHVFAIIHDTDWAEASEFLRGMWSPAALAFLAVIAVAVRALRTLLAGLLWREDDLTARLAFRYGNRPVQRVIENKSGVIHAVRSKQGGDYIYGGNVYDGTANIDPRVNSNGLQRVFVLAALKPEPKDVLIIGLSTGAWARILTGFPGIERIDAVEINPGYLELIRDYPHISPFLADPRLSLYIDDGRRWLRRHPDRRYDLIVMNTTLHWRAYITNLLSREYLSLIRAHLEPGGVITYNATGSPDVLRTAEEAFPYAFRYASFVVASDHNFRSGIAGGEAQLYRIALDGRQTFDPASAEDREFIHQTLAEPFVSSRQDRIAMDRDPEIITDWNLIPEYKYGREFPCVLSPYLITGVADLFIQAGRALTGAATFVLLLLPTCLMGATLPMLIAHFVRTHGGVGISTGQLYFVNTLGAAIGCLGVGFFAFNFLTLKQVIQLAATVNALVAISAFARFRGRT